MLLFSIIVPVYKAEKYISECVDSVLAQTFEDFELILADDGSPDRCPEICDEYAKKDSRIKVIHKENGGASSARNSGIDAACGEYIIFLDSDDYWEENYTLQRLDGKIKRRIRHYNVRLQASQYRKRRNEAFTQRLQHRPA